MPMELMLETNPFRPGLEALPVRLLWQSGPLARRQITVLRRKSDGSVTRTLAATDRDRRAVIALAGDGDYLRNAVQLEPAEDDDVVWASHWASHGARARTRVTGILGEIFSRSASRE